MIKMNSKTVLYVYN